LLPKALSTSTSSVLDKALIQGENALPVRDGRDSQAQLLGRP
jgi:hypothetical protein